MTSISDDIVRRRMRLPGRPLSPAGPAALRQLLPLHLVPARKRLGVRGQRHDRGRSREPARGRAREGRDAVGERRGPDDRPLPAMPDRALEQLRRRRRIGPLRSRRHASTSRRGCRPTSTSSPRPSSRGSCCPRACRRCRSTTTASSTGRPRASSGARHCARALAADAGPPGRALAPVARYATKRNSTLPSVAEIGAIRARSRQRGAPVHEPVVTMSPAARPRVLAGGALAS